MVLLLCRFGIHVSAGLGLSQTVSVQHWCQCFCLPVMEVAWGWDLLPCYALKKTNCRNSALLFFLFHQTLSLPPYNHVWHFHHLISFHPILCKILLTVITGGSLWVQLCTQRLPPVEYSGLHAAVHILCPVWPVYTKIQVCHCRLWAGLTQAGTAAHDSLHVACGDVSRPPPSN